MTQARDDEEEAPKKPSGLGALFGLGGGSKTQKVQTGTTSNAKASPPASATKKVVAPPARGSIKLGGGTSKQVGPWLLMHLARVFVCVRVKCV